MTFNFHAKYVLLTYAQCGELDAFRVMDKLSLLGAECIIGREHHENGGIHLHCFAEFGRKFRSRKANVFDVDGIHPNIKQSYGTPEKGYDYAIKDGDVLCGGLGRPKPRSVGSGPSDSKWAIITSAKDRDEFWELVHELDPKAAATSFSQLQRYCDWKYQYHAPEYESPTGAHFIGAEFDGRARWLEQSGIGSGEKRGGRVKSLVLYGPSQTGKTSWARSLGKHIYCVGLVSGTECLKAPDVEYAVFDDIRGGIKFFHSFKEWLGCQPHLSVKELYREPKVIEWGKPSIWCSNADPRNEMLMVDIEWMEMNCTFIEITEPVVEFN